MGVVPPFAERLDEIADRRPSDLELDVVPRRRRAKALIDIDRLTVTEMVLVIIASMAQIDAADECHVIVREPGMQHDEQLLVVAAGSSNAFIEQNVAACRVDRRCQIAVLFLAEPCPAGV